LDHVRFLAGLVLRDWRRSLARPTSCAVALGAEKGNYLLIDLEAANFAAAEAKRLQARVHMACDDRIALGC
jgi:hypothetical protein